MGTDESLAVSTMSRPTQGPSSSLEEFPQKIGVPLQEPKNKQPLNHLPQEPPESWGKSWLPYALTTNQNARVPLSVLQYLPTAILAITSTVRASPPRMPTTTKASLMV